MAQFATLKTDGNPTQALQHMLARLLDEGVVDAVLVPARQPHGHVVMQSLVSDSGALTLADPLAPVVFTNAATLLSSLTHTPTDKTVAAVVRSCEVRAFVERAKLNQGTPQNLLLIGLDCFGRFENRDYLSLAAQHESPTSDFLRAAPDSEGLHGVHIARACKACEYPVAPSVDLRICLFGENIFDEIHLEAVTDAGAAALESLALPKVGDLPNRKAAVTALLQRRTTFRAQMFEACLAQTRDMDGLRRATAACINCYNCRVACPLCYCRECVFSTDLFRHDSIKYLSWSRKRGMIRMPTDTLFYHLTRMVHMSTLCVGCGQCSSACPNGIDVMELFRTTAAATQARFGYEPGRDLSEKQPMATFHEDEFQDVTGLGK
jgi:formate dehydrogenase subunit beta